MRRSAIKDFRALSYIPLDPPACRPFVRVDPVDAIRQTFFNNDRHAAVIARVHAVSTFDTLYGSSSEPTLTQNPVRSSTPRVYFGLH